MAQSMALRSPAFSAGPIPRLSRRAARGPMAVRATKQQAPILERMAPALLAGIVAITGMSAAYAPIACAEGEEFMSPYQRRQVEMERRRELLREARERAAARASASEDETPAAPAPAASEPDKPASDFASQAAARLKKESLKSYEDAAKNRPSVPATPEPQEAPAPAFPKFGGFRFSKPDEAPATPAPAPVSPAPKPAVPVPAPATPEPQEAPAPAFPKFGGFRFSKPDEAPETPAPAPAPVSPAPKPAVPVPATPEPQEAPAPSLPKFGGFRFSKPAEAPEATAPAAPTAPPAASEPAKAASDFASQAAAKLKESLKSYEDAAKNRPSALDTPEPQEAPAPSLPFGGFRFSKPAEAPTPAPAPAASESDKPASDFASQAARLKKESLKVYEDAAKNRPKVPASPEPQEAPGLSLPKFGGFPFFSKPSEAPTPAPAPAPTPVTPAPKPALPVPVPAPAATRKVEQKVSEPSAGQKKTQDASKKRRGPLPLWFAEILVLGVYVGLGLAVTKYSEQSGKVLGAVWGKIIQLYRTVEELTSNKAQPSA